MKGIKRTLSFVLALILALGAMPLEVFAVETEVSLTDLDKIVSKVDEDDFLVAAEKIATEGVFDNLKSTEENRAELQSFSLSETREQNLIYGLCGENAAFVFDKLTGTLTVSGTGDMYDRGIDLSYCLMCFDPMILETSEIGFQWDSDESPINPDDIRVLVVEEGITGIGNRAFFNCKNIEEISLPKTLRRIGTDAFDKGVGEIEEGCRYVGDVILGYSDSGKDTVLKIKEGTRIIADWAFGNCVAEKIYIPASVESVGNYTFSLGAIERIEVSEDNPYYSHGATGELFNKDGTELIFFPHINMQDYSYKYEIPETVTKIGKGAFFDSEIRTVFIGENIEEIGTLAFGASAVSLFGVDEKNKHFSNDENGILYNKDKTELVCFPIANYDILCDKDGYYHISDTVETIGDYSFFDLYMACYTPVYIPGNVKTIGEGSFMGNPFSWVGFVLSEGLENIGDFAFAGSTNYDMVKIPDSVKKIGMCAFAYAPSDFVLGSGSTEIGKNAFFSVVSVTATHIPDGMTKADFTDIDFFDVYIPERVTEIITCGPIDISGISPENQYYSLDEYGVLFNKDKTRLIAASSDLSGDYVIPDGVTTIDKSAFEGLKSLNSITIPQSVTSIGVDAFYDCGKNIDYDTPDWYGELTNAYYQGDVADWCAVKFNGQNSNPAIWAANFYINGNKVQGELVIPSGVTSIGDYAFASYDSITSVTISDGVTTIGEYAFTGCSGLTNIVIPDSVTTIGESAFAFCSGLKDITLPEGISCIENAVFEYCTSLKSVIIPDSVTSIGKEAFLYCSNITTVTIGKGVEIIGYDAFFACENISTINYNAEYCMNGEYSHSPFGRLYGCVINIGEDVREICDYMFYEISATEINIAEGVEVIGEGAFGYHMAERVSLPSTVENIGKGALLGVNFRGYEVSENNPHFSADEFGVLFNKDKTVLVSAPCNLYFAADIYSVPPTVTQIEELAFLACSCSGIKIPAGVEMLDNAFFMSVVAGIEVDADNAYYSSDRYGALYDKGQTKLMYLPFVNMQVTEYTMPDTVADYESTVFQFYAHLESITFSASLEKIKDSTFANFKALKTVNFSENSVLKEIGNSAFKECLLLTEINLPHSVETIGDSAFERCTGLINLTLSDGLKSIGLSAFCDCTQLTSVNISRFAPLKEIGDMSFFYCYNLKSFTFPESLETIGEGAFCGCDSLEAIDFSRCGSLREIGRQAFSNCYTIPEIVVPENVVFIGENAFANCESVKKIILPEGLEELESSPNYNNNYSDAFYNCYGVEYIKANEKSLRKILPFSFFPNLIRVEIVGEYDESFVPKKLENVLATGTLNSIHISWSKSAEVNTEYYRIFKKSQHEEKFSYLTEISNRETLSYTDTNVEEDTIYTYVVIGVDSETGMITPLSEEAVATRALDEEPPTVTKLFPAQNTTIARVHTVTVSAIDNVQPMKVGLYYLKEDGATWELVGEDTYAPFTVALDTTKFPDGKLRLKAVAYDAKNNVSSPMECEYIIDNTGPEKVTGLNAKAVLSSKITLEWNDVADKDATYFILQQKTGDKYVTIASSITDLGYNLSNLQADTSYTYRVAAVDLRGNQGEYSDDYTVSTAKDTSAPVVTSLAPDPGRYNNQIRFVVGAGDDCSIKSIKVQTSKDRINWKDVSTANYTDQRRSISYACNVPLEEFSDGSIYIRAIATDSSDNVSDTSESAPYVEYYVDKSAPDIPRDLVACGMPAVNGQNQIYISWLQGDEADTASYDLYRAESVNGPWSNICSRYTKISYYDKTVKADTVYYYRLRVRDTVGNVSDFTQPVSAKAVKDDASPEIIAVNPPTNTVVGPDFRTVKACIYDNSCIETVVFEYRTGTNEEFAVLKEFKNVGTYNANLSVALPVNGMNNGDKVYLRIIATDIAGNVSENNTEYTYIRDAEAPAVKNLKAEVISNSVFVTWEEVHSDTKHYDIYRVDSNGNETYVARKKNSSGYYSFSDAGVCNLGSGDYTYKICAYDKVGNSSNYITDIIHYEKEEIQKPVTNPAPQPEIVIQHPKRENAVPVAVITGYATMEVGVEEYFDAGKSTDDVSIVEYHWDFGDGTTSNKVKAVKKFDKPGNYTVTLTLTDGEGAKSSKTLEVQVNERTVIGNLKIQVVDENGDSVSNAPVYLDLGGENQKKIFSDSSGIATVTMEKGDHSIGAYKDGYLPVQKTVTVLPNATRNITLTIIKQQIVTGEFEVTRMTFKEIEAAGIDVLKPENQQVYSVNAKIVFEGAVIPIRYIRNDTEIIDYEIRDIDWELSFDIPDPIPKPTPSPNPDPDPDPEPDYEREIIDIGFVPNEENKEVVAVMTVPAKASCLKEFFDVQLHIVNNATEEFELVENEVNLAVPDGMTLMDNLTGDWSTTPNVTIDSIIGQETETVSWVLRGDDEGEYDLTADYNGTLAVFNEPVSATFKTDEPIKVFGLNSYKMIIESNDEIKYNAFYFNFGIENITGVDLHNPVLDFDGIVSNITNSAKQLAEGIDKSSGKTSFDVVSSLLNVRIEYHDGTEQHVPFSWKSDGTVYIGLDTLSPGDAIYYEYVAYNAINFDDIAYFKDSSVEVLSGYSENVEVRSAPITLFSFMSAEEKLSAMLEMGDSDMPDQSSVNYVRDRTYYAKYKSGATKKQINSSFIYDDALFTEKSTEGVIPGLALASLNIASSAYAGEEEMQTLLGRENLGFSNLYSENYDVTPTEDDNDFVAFTFGTKEITVSDEKYDLVVISVRGTTSDLAWLSNMNVGLSGTEHLGFALASQKMYLSFEEYCKDKKLDSETTKIWITGHSRGAAVANIIAEKFTVEEKYAKAENIYAYTFATPNTTSTANEDLRNIINYCNEDDLIGSIPFEQWGFKKAGVTIDFSLDGEAETAFNIMNDTVYDGTDITELVNKLLKVVPGVGEFYSSGANLLFNEIAKFLGKSSVNIADLILGFDAVTASAPLETVSLASTIIGLFKEYNGKTFIEHPHCSEAYISYLNSIYSQESVIAYIKKIRGDVIKPFEVKSSNALDYILDDSNFMYTSNASRTDKALAGLYEELRFLLTLDFNVITKEDQKKIAEKIMLEMITDENMYPLVDDLIDTQYINTVKNVLSVLKNTASEIDDDGLNPFIDSLGNMLGNSSEVYALSSTLKNEGTDSFRKTLENRIVGSLVAGSNLEYIREMISDCCDIGDEESALFKGLSGIGEYGGLAIELSVGNAVDAVNEAAHEQYVHTLINMSACKEEAKIILDTVINVINYPEFFLGRYIYDKINDHLYTFGLIEFDTEVKKIVSGAAEDLKSKIDSNFDIKAEALRNYLKETTETVITEVFSAAIKKFLGKANIYYALAGEVFNLLDTAFGWRDKNEQINTFNISAYISFVLRTGLISYFNCFATGNVKELNSALKTDYNENDREEISINTMYLLKSLINSRLIGEQAIKLFISKENGNVAEDDSDYDAKAVEKCNRKFGTEYSNSEDLFDYIYGNILKSRDALFNIEETTDIVKPEAPEVTFNYETFTTNEAFDSTYEYCYSDGSWKVCTGEPIYVKPKKHATILRVRKASGHGTVAGEITTISINAQRELNKSISASYYEGQYHFKNLSALYSYQICPLNTPVDTVDWSRSYTVKGCTGATVSGIYGKYIAIRSLGNEELRETISLASIISVSEKQHLNIIICGNGEVSQTNENGMYFIGDKTELTATPHEGEMFEGWYIDGELMSRDTFYILEMYRYAEITAKFTGGDEIEAERIDLTFAAESEAAGISQESEVQMQSVNTAYVYSGTTAKLYAGVYPENTLNKYITWETSDPDIASIDENGIVSFHAPGSVTITAKLTLNNNISASFRVVVLENAVEELYLQSGVEKTTYLEGEELDCTGLKVFAEYTDGEMREVFDYEVTGYDSSYGLKTVTVSYGGKSVSFNVSVVHNTAWAITEEPTCSEEGCDSFYCIVCGEVLETRPVPMTAHSGEWVVTKEATAETDGIKSNICVVCGEILDEVTYPFCEHEYKITVVEPTCKEKGYTTQTCLKCGKVITDNYIDVLEHKYTSEIIAPSCGKGGYTVNVCALCNDVTVTDYTDAIEHTYTQTTVEADCMNPGYTVYECSVCGDSYKDNYTSIKEHIYGSVETQASCEEAGMTIYTCDICGDSYSVVSEEPAGHLYEAKIVNATCNEGEHILHTCKVCGHSYKSDEGTPLAHSFGEWMIRVPATEYETGLKYRICNICSYEETKGIPTVEIGCSHSDCKWVVEKEATCSEYGVKTQICNECGEATANQIIEATGHSYESTVIESSCVQGGYTINTCTVCGKIEKSDFNEATGHAHAEWVVEIQPECTLEGYRTKRCPICNELIAEETIEATGHINCEWVEISKATCTELGYREKWCNDCGAIIEKETTSPFGHNYHITVVKGSCTENGYTIYSCSECGDTYESDFVEAAGHIEGAWTVVTKPTSFTEGLRQKKCTVCNVVLGEEIIPALSNPDIGSQKIKLNRTNYTMMVDGTYKLTATVSEEITNPVISWYSSDENVASVDSNGTVTAVGEGTATIYAGIAEVNETATCVITVIGNPSEEITLAIGSGLVKNNSYISGFSIVADEENRHTVTVAETKDMFLNCDLEFVDAKGNEMSDEDYIGTGTVITLLDGNNVLDSVTVVITGDVDGDGYINNRDASRVSRYLVDKESPNDAQINSMDMNKDGYVNNRDASWISRYLVGKETF